MVGVQVLLVVRMVFACIRVPKRLVEAVGLSTLGAVARVHLYQGAARSLGTTLGLVHQASRDSPVSVILAHDQCCDASEHRSLGEQRRHVHSHKADDLVLDYGYQHLVGMGLAERCDPCLKILLPAGVPEVSQQLLDGARVPFNGVADAWR